jgi:hypothetical protein
MSPTYPGSKRKPINKPVRSWQQGNFCSSTMKMEVLCSFETSACFRRTIQRYIPKDRILNRPRDQTLRSSQSSCIFRRSWIQILAQLSSICFPRSLQINSWLRQYHFLTDSLQFVYRESSYHQKHHTQKPLKFTLSMAVEPFVGPWPTF